MQWCPKMVIHYTISLCLVGVYDLAKLLADNVIMLVDDLKLIYPQAGFESLKRGLSILLGFVSKISAPQ